MKSLYEAIQKLQSEQMDTQIQTDRQTDRHADRQTDMQTHRNTETQTDRQTDTTGNITYPHTQVVKSNSPTRVTAFEMLIIIHTHIWKQFRY